MDGWTNEDNIAFYESDEILDVLKGYATIAGFDKHCDVALISHLLLDAKSIIDIGAGYGRVLDYLIEKNYQGQLYALERSARYCKELRNKFKDKVKVYESDIQSFNSFEKFQVAIWMWSGVSDFSREEQAHIFKKIFEMVNENGIFIMDTLLHSIKPINATMSDHQHYIVETHGHIAKGYIPSEEEIDDYSKALKLRKIEHVHYTTATGRERLLHIIYK